MVVCFFFSFLFGLLSAFLIFAMIKVKIKKREIRRIVVKAYKVIMVCSQMFMAISIVIMVLQLYTFVYTMLYNFSFVISNSIEFAKYISLTVILVTFQPLVYCILKLVKKKLYKEMEIKEMQDFGTDMINKIINYINNIPAKGIIHIINLGLVILANSCKALNIDTNLTTTSIYMSVATFYALDKVIDYFAKKYRDLWIIIDNKLFETEKIDKDVEFGLSSLKNVKELIFFNYVETGKYSLE